MMARLYLGPMDASCVRLRCVKWVSRKSFTAVRTTDLEAVGACSPLTAGETLIIIFMSSGIKYGRPLGCSIQHTRHIRLPVDFSETKPSWYCGDFTSPKIQMVSDSVHRKD